MYNAGIQALGMLMDKQRQQANYDIADRAYRNQQMQQMLEAGGKLASTVAGSIQQGKQNAIANSLMTQEDNSIPRAQAVDQNGQSGASIQAAADNQIPADRPHTGGMDELKLRLAMEQNRRANLGQQLQGARMQDAQAYRANSLGERSEYHQGMIDAKAAAAAAAATNQKTKEAVTSANAYFKTAGVTQRQMAAAQKAGDFDAFNRAAQELQAAYWGTKSAGVDLPELEVPEFRPPNAPAPADYQQHLDEWNTARGQAMQPGQWDAGATIMDKVNPWSKNTYGKQFMDASDTLYHDQRLLPRPADRYVPPAQAAPSQQPTTAPIGQIVVDPKTGQRMQKTANGWQSI